MILNVIGGKDLSLDEVITAADLVKGVIDYSANVIFGACIDEGMSDEVEVVIIATGFTNSTNGMGFDAQNAASRQASVLAQKIDSAYGKKIEMEPANAFQNATPYYAQQPAQQPAQMPMSNGSFAQSYAMPQAQDVYACYAQPAPTVVASFEPDDPIPEAKAEDSADRKHRPRFVDFFMKKNSNDNKQ